MSISSTASLTTRPAQAIDTRLDNIRIDRSATAVTVTNEGRKLALLTLPEAVLAPEGLTVIGEPDVGEWYEPRRSWCLWLEPGAAATLALSCT